MTLPFKEPVEVVEPGPRVIPEPPRRGETGGEPCAICSAETTPPVWADSNWTLHPASGGSIPGTVWLASKVHVDSFADFPDELAATFGRVCRAVDAAILSLGGFARVHLYRWGDGGSHFHVWFLPRPLGFLEAKGAYLPIWEDVMPNVSDEELRAAAEKIAAALPAEA